MTETQNTLNPNPRQSHTSETARSASGYYSLGPWCSDAARSSPRLLAANAARRPPALTLQTPAEPETPESPKPLNPEALKT